MTQDTYQPFTVPHWVNAQQPEGQLTLLGVCCDVTLADAELIGERIAILTTDGKCDEETAQRAALHYLNRKRRKTVTSHHTEGADLAGETSSPRDTPGG